MISLESNPCQEVERDLERRTLNGAYIYLLGWLAIGTGTDFYLTESKLFYSIATALSLFGISRLVFYRYSHHIKKRSSRLWWGILTANVVLPCMLYSTIFALSMFVPSFAPLMLYIFMAIFALISSGTLTYALNRNLYRAYLAANTLIPIVIVPIFATSIEAKLEAGVLVFYTIYMLFQGQQLNKEYQLKIEQAHALKELSTKDGLTGLYNRRHFDQYLDYIWQYQMELAQSLTIVLVDIDHFKRVNDQYGHPAGDATIKLLADTMKEVFYKEADVIARIGGEEFAVIIPDITQNHAYELTERLREVIEKLTIVHQDAAFSVSISAGIAGKVPSADFRSDSLLNNADKALYKAKASGRNLSVLDYA